MWGAGAGLAMAVLFGSGSAAAEPPLQWSAPLEIAGVPAGDRVVMADGRTVRLAGVRLAGPAEPAAAPAAAAQAALTQLVSGQSVRLGTEAPTHDRFGQLVAHLERADGLWLQGTLLEQGRVQVQTRPGETARATEMLALERAAREARRGLWAEPAFAVRAAEDLTGVIGSFQIVRGRVRRVAPTERYLYLNFGADWRTDFTVRLARAERGRLEARLGHDIAALEGRLVEVRGFVLEAAGPLIALSHPEQFEVLE
jgi:endonuclease YncB( thermonuclease family)